ncbi:MAG: class I SAM-dependent methyltransferase [Candidatus Zixiibacteriota bacterium]|nr:MAG: class I SAM-dependent methyltransferase [candidate division Zixibacteria bacterium]
MMKSPKGAERLIDYLEKSLQTEIPVAPFELSQDSQTKFVINKIKDLSGPISVLDFGCGNLRLLNAARIEKILHNIKYLATDKIKPKATFPDQYPYEFVISSKIRELPLDSIDLVVLMNVAHEMSIVELADAVESSRRLLKRNGELLIIDMAILPEGEYLALPFYPWELASLFLESIDHSYLSKNGVPIVAMSIKRDGIPIYAQFMDRLYGLTIEKRNYYCQLACTLPIKRNKATIQKILKRFSLNKGDVHDLGYLMLMSGLAHSRLLQLANSIPEPNYDEVAEAAEDVLKYFFSYWETHESSPTFFAVLENLGHKHTYRSLTHAVGYMSGGIPAFFMPLLKDNLGLSTLEASEDLDIFEDRFEYSDIKRLGLGNLQGECHEHIETGNMIAVPCADFNTWIH